MADVTLERKKDLSREEAAVWLSALSHAFARGGDVKLPVGSGGTVGLHLPDHVQAEFEVEVDGDEVQVEVEFTWTMSHAAADTKASSTPDA